MRLIIEEARKMDQKEVQDLVHLHHVHHQQLHLLMMKKQNLKQQKWFLEVKDF
jgi:hypothetical protein